jgi:hypothetical protein
MKITLEVPEEHNRSNHPVECYLCGRRFVVGSVVALAFSNADSSICGEVCPKCLAAGPEEMREDLECCAEWTRQEADLAEKMADEEITAPTAEDLKLMESIAAL